MFYYFHFYFIITFSDHNKLLKCIKIESKYRTINMYTEFLFFKSDSTSPLQDCMLTLPLSYSIRYGIKTILSYFQKILRRVWYKLSIRGKVFCAVNIMYG